MIIGGEIGLLWFEDVERFVADSALMTDGTGQPAVLLVLATGYHTQQELVRRLTATPWRRGWDEIWGFDADGETANMWRQTAQEGLWFMAGSLAQCRIYSKHLALQIKAREAGLIAG